MALCMDFALMFLGQQTASHIDSLWMHNSMQDDNGHVCTLRVRSQESSATSCLLKHILVEFDVARRKFIVELHGIIQVWV